MLETFQYDSVMAAAMRAAGELHDKIEAIYKNAVDFDGVRELMSRVIKEIFED